VKRRRLENGNMRKRRRRNKKKNIITGTAKFCGFRHNKTTLNGYTSVSQYRALSETFKIILSKEFSRAFVTLLW
jgi:hypothetical protein